MARFDYNRNTFADALRQVGLKRGDVVFSHSNVGFFGIPEEGASKEIIFQTLLDGFLDVIGKEGTLVLPTFTFSFCDRRPFDPDQTPSTCGVFTEMFRRLPNALRSHDPIFSIAAIGPRAVEFTDPVSPECVGQGSFFERFLKADGVICNLNFDSGSTFIHYVEWCLKVPYHFDKVFPGTVVHKGRPRRTEAIYFCRDISIPETLPAFEPFDRAARRKGLVRSAAVGRGEVVRVAAKDTYALIEDEIKADPLFLTAGAGSGKRVVLPVPSKPNPYRVTLAGEASMSQMLEGLWTLPRDIVSDGSDAAMDALALQLPMEIRKLPTGMHLGNRIVPEKWTCLEAHLDTVAGQRLFSYSDSPLHAVSYSSSFEGEVSREVLLQHLHVHDSIPEAVPFKQVTYESREWGLCCAQKARQTLKEDRYRVVLRTEVSASFLRAGEIVVQGTSDESVVLFAHLGGPGMANRGLSGVAAGVEVMRRLRKQSRHHYTYRLWIAPGDWGPCIYKQERRAGQTKAALSLDLLGLPKPPSLQFSSLESAESSYPFPELDSDQDTFQRVSLPALESSVEQILRLMTVLEADAMKQPGRTGVR